MENQDQRDAESQHQENPQGRLGARAVRTDYRSIKNSPQLATPLPRLHPAQRP